MKYIALLSLLFLIGCSSTRVTEQKVQAWCTNTIKDEIVISNNFETFLKNKSSRKLSVVIRDERATAVKSGHATDSYFPSILEKELMTNEYLLRNQTIFEEVKGKIKSPTFKKYQKHLETDLLIEISNAGTQTVMKTNKFIDGEGKPTAFISDDFEASINQVSVKVILLESGETAAYFTLYDVLKNEKCLSYVIHKEVNQNVNKEITNVSYRVNGPENQSSKEASYKKLAQKVLYYLNGGK
ncbi:MAG: hypothetical protein OCD01_05485 [Fibrobacterales bacterium]